MRIKSESTTWSGIFSLVALVVFGVIGSYAYLMWRDGRFSILVGVVVTPFFAVAFLLGYLGFRGLLRAMVFGVWEVGLPSGSGVLGRSFPVILYPRRAVTPTGELRCTIRCVQVTVMNSGKNRSSKQDTLWEKEWSRRVETIQPERGVRIEIPLPDPGHAIRGSGGSINWQLNVYVPMRGLSDEAVFHVPVVSS